MDGPFKIGKADDVNKRLTQLQTSIELHIFFFVFVENASEIEGQIHKQLKNYRGNGEWFNCDFQTAKTAIENFAVVEPAE
jgi:hypothetical protein